MVLDAPASTISSIIGVKGRLTFRQYIISTTTRLFSGATLKQIRDQTNVRVDIPRKDTLAPNGNGQATAASSGNASPLPPADEDEEPTIPVTITGPKPMVQEAREMLNAIISLKTSKTTQRVRDIPANVFPFVMARRGQFLAAADGGDIQLNRNEAAREISVSGDREAVVRVIEVIKSTVESYKSGLTSLKISLPKRQHRLLSGTAVDEIMTKSGCSVVVSAPEDPSDELTVWGKGEHLPAGLQAVMEKANSQYIHEYPLPGPITLSKQILTFMTRTGYTKTLATAHTGAFVYTPPQAVVDKAQTLNIDIVGEKAAVDSVVKQISELVSKLIGATREITVDWLVHRVVIGKNAKKYAHLYGNTKHVADNSFQESSS